MFWIGHKIIVVSNRESYEEGKGYIIITFYYLGASLSDFSFARRGAPMCAPTNEKSERVGLSVLMGLCCSYFTKPYLSATAWPACVQLSSVSRIINAPYHFYPLRRFQRTLQCNVPTGYSEGLSSTLLLLIVHYFFQRKYYWISHLLR